jgi:hypothetical protein
MLQELEEFFGTHQHTVAALEAGSTFAAVVVELALSLVSRRANRTRIKASAASTIIMHETIEAPDYPGYVTVDIMNNGILPVMIPLISFTGEYPSNAVFGWSCQWITAKATRGCPRNDILL